MTSTCSRVAASSSSLVCSMCWRMVSRCLAISRWFYFLRFFCYLRLDFSRQICSGVSSAYFPIHTYKSISGTQGGILKQREREQQDEMRKGGLVNRRRGWGVVCQVRIHIIRRRMLRSLLLKPPRHFHCPPEEEVLFPDVAKTNNRQTLNSRELFDTTPFLRITNEGELRWQMDCLQSYSADRLRFVARVQVNQGKSEQQRNEVLLVRQPIFSSEDVITFLLVLKWLPNAMKTYKPARKASTATEKDIKGRPRRAESVELLQLVFLLAEKVYLGEKYVDEFVHLIAERNGVTPRQANSLAVVLPAHFAKGDHFLSTNVTSSQYQEYLYQTTPAYNPSGNRSEHDRSSLHSVDSHPNTLALLKRRSPRNSQRSPRYASLRQSEARSASQQLGKQRRVSCNLSKTKRYFSVVQYLITQGEVGVETIMCHLNDDRNTINCGFVLTAVKELLQEWPRHSQSASLAQLNQDLALKGQVEQSLANYRLVAVLELSQLASISVDAIYTVVRQLNSKAMNEFLTATRQYLHDQRYNDTIAHLEAELCALQGELISNYALGKYEQGRRLLRDLQKRRGRKGTLDSSLLMRLVGREEVGALDMGFKMYRQLLEGRVEQGFKELGQGQLRGRMSLTGNNDEDMLANIEGRIQICQEKRRMLEAAIQLSEKEADSLQMMMRSLDHRAQTEHLSVVSDTQE